jgi:hypothetical protein
MKFNKQFGQFHRLNCDTLTIVVDFVIGSFFELENIIYYVFCMLQFIQYQFAWFKSTLTIYFLPFLFTIWEKKWFVSFEFTFFTNDDFFVLN